MTLSVLALDLSLTSTGVCLPDGSTTKITTKAADRLEERLTTIVRGLAEMYYSDEDGEVRKTDLVVVEDLPKHARSAGITGPVHGAVRYWLHAIGATVVTIPPASLKLYATGKGNSNKDAMGIAAMKRADVDFSGRPDECDAWWLWAMTLDAYGHPVVDLPAAHRKAMEKIAWPDLSEVAA